VRVRVYGMHSQDPQDVPVSSLPWAIPACAMQNAFSIPRVGSKVFVFFDGGNHNAPIYFASAPDKADWDWSKEGVEPGRTAIVFEDGQAIVVDSNESTLAYSHPSGATVTVDSGGAVTVHGTSLTLKSDGDLDLTADGDLNIEALGNIKESAGGNLESKANVIHSSKGSVVTHQ